MNDRSSCSRACRLLYIVRLIMSPPNYLNLAIILSQYSEQIKGGCVLWQMEVRILLRFFRDVRGQRYRTLHKIPYGR